MHLDEAISLVWLDMRVEDPQTELLVTVIYRAELGELRSRWDDKYFGVYGLEG